MSTKGRSPWWGLRLGVPRSWLMLPASEPTLAASATAFPGVLHFIVAAWTVALPWIASAVMAATAAIPMHALETDAAQVAYALAAAVLLVGAPVFLLARLSAALVVHLSQERNGSRSLLASLLVGVFVGLLADVFFLAPFAGVQIGGLAAALGSGVLFFRSLLQENQSEVPVDAVEPGGERIGGGGREQLRQHARQLADVRQVHVPDPLAVAVEVVLHLALGQDLLQLVVGELDQVGAQLGVGSLAPALAVDLGERVAMPLRQLEELAEEAILGRAAADAEEDAADADPEAGGNESKWDHK